MTALQPDVVGTTAITLSINAAERALEIAALPVPQAVRGGIYATFMYQQVLAEAVGSVRTVITASGTHTQKDSFRVHLPTRSWRTVGRKLPVRFWPANGGRRPPTSKQA